MNPDQPKTDFQISRRDPEGMDKGACLDEIHELKDRQPPGWRARAHRLVTRLASLEGVPGAGFGAPPSEGRVAETADPGAGDDPLAARVRAVEDADRKSKIGPACGGTSRAADAHPLAGEAAWTDDGHLTPIAQPAECYFPDEPRPTPTEDDRIRDAQKMAMVHLLFWLTFDGKDRLAIPGNVFIRARIAENYLDPRKSQNRLADELAVSRGAMSGMVNDFEAKIRQIYVQNEQPEHR